MTEEWPSYFTGRRDHIHALGVISLSYSAFERDLFTLYAHHPGVQGMPRELVEKYWSSQNEASQVKSVREIFKMYETAAAPLEFVNKLMDYFDWCSHTRNQLMHSEFYPSLFGGKPDKLYLVKRASKTKPDPIYITLSVDQLRDIADKIEHGKRQCAALRRRLKLWDLTGLTTIRPIISREAITSEFRLKLCRQKRMYDRDEVRLLSDTVIFRLVKAFRTFSGSLQGFSGNSI